MAAKKKKSLAQRIAADPKLKARYLSNPGLRSKLSDSSLTPELRKRRAANAYNATPITEGSSVTNAQLGREADSATLVQYGAAGRDLQAQQAREQAVGRDTAGWYDQYRRELQQHTANTALINQAAVGQIGQLGAGMRGLDQTSLGAQQGAANADAATRGASAADLGPDASNASLVRQQMLANFGVQQVGLGAAATRYADTAANVVAPTQQLQARAQSAQNVRDVGKKITDLKSEAGAFNTNYREKRTADESKNVLARQALTLDDAKAKNDAKTDADKIDIARGVDPVTGKKINKPKTAAAKKTEADLAFFRKHGYYPPTGPPKAGKGSKPVSGPGSLTPVKEQKVLSDVRKIQQRLANPMKDKVDPITGAKTRVRATPREALSELVAGDTDPDAIAVAQSLARNKGKLDAKGTAAAHRLGIHIGPNFKIVPKKKPKKTTALDVAKSGGTSKLSPKAPASLRP